MIKGEPRKLWAVDSDTTLSADPLTNDRWYHVAVTTNGATGEVKFYIDGQLSGVRKKNAGGIEQTSMPVNIAREQRGGGRWNFEGTIDDVRIYNEVLTQAEIQDIMKGEAYPFASGPTPADGDIRTETWVTLNWSPGDFAVSHNVYLGENFDDVNDGTGDTFQGNQTATYFLAGFAGYPYPDGLVPGTTYYWRIDEVNDANAASPWKGEVWSFTFPPKKGYGPEPADGATFVAPDATLSWTAGWGAVTHTVYFGDDYDTVLNTTDGTDDYVDLDDPAKLRITGNITLAAWIRSEGVGSERNIIAKGYVFDPHGEIRLQLNGSNYNVGSLDSDGQHEVSAVGADADISQWVHVAGTYDGSNWNIYRNGQLLNTAENSVGAVPVAVGWAIGARGGDMIDQLFEGLIDDVRI